MKRKLPVFKTASLALIAGLGVYAISNHNALGEISRQGTASMSANAIKLSADSTFNARSSYIPQIVQLMKQIELQLHNTVQQLLQGVGGQSLVSQSTQTKTQLQNQVQSEWKQAQSQFQSLWHQAQQFEKQLPQQLQSPSQDGWQQTQSPSESSSQSQATGQALSLPAATQASGNWAGYIDTPRSGSYKNVHGTWIVPNISGNQNGVAAQWIGLGGATNHDLLQMGTLEQFNNGQPAARIFWEKLPGAAKPVMTVPIGSTISASISHAFGTMWYITFSAQTPGGKTTSKTIPVSVSSSYAAGIGTSAEWISEDPSNANNNLYPLANTGTVQYSSATVNGQALSVSNNQVVPLALVDKYGDLLMAPSAVGSNGSTFSTDTLSTGVGAGGQLIGGTGGQTFVPGAGDRWGSGRHHFHEWGRDSYTVYGYGYGFGDNLGS